VTRYNLPPADDPASMESLLRTRKSQLAAGRRVERATATAEHDADELLRLMRTMPPDLRLTVAEGEALTARTATCGRTAGRTRRSGRRARR
jgi:hypothetical protein